VDNSPIKQAKVGELIDPLQHQGMNHSLHTVHCPENCKVDDHIRARAFLFAIEDVSLSTTGNLITLEAFQTQALNLLSGRISLSLFKENTRKIFSRQPKLYDKLKDFF